MVKSAVPKDNTEYPEPNPAIVFPEYLGRDAAGNDVIAKDADEKKARLSEVVQTPQEMSQLSKTDREKPPEAAAKVQKPELVKSEAPKSDKTDK